MDYLRALPGYIVEVAPDTNPDTIKKLIADADAVVTRLTILSKDILRYGARLKAVCKHGVGVDNIDTAYCETRGIRVLTTGDANSTSVAEHAMFAIGAMFKRIPWLDSRMRERDWLARDSYTGRDLNQKTLGLIGFGRIGSRLAGMASRGFGMNVCVYDPYAARESIEREGYAYCETLSEMLPKADVISLHVPLTPETTGIISDAQLSMLKKGACVVNFSRGGTVDEAALARALIDGRVSFAALDVFTREPPPFDDPLLRMDNVLLSPHCATFTEDSRINMSMRLAIQIEETLK